MGVISNSTVAHLIEGNWDIPKAKDSRKDHQRETYE